MHVHESMLQLVHLVYLQVKLQILQGLKCVKLKKGNCSLKFNHVYSWEQTKFPTVVAKYSTTPYAFLLFGNSKNSKTEFLNFNIFSRHLPNFICTISSVRKLNWWGNNISTSGYRWVIFCIIFGTVFLYSIQPISTRNDKIFGLGSKKKVCSALICHHT